MGKFYKQLGRRCMTLNCKKYVLSLHFEEIRKNGLPHHQNMVERNKSFLAEFTNNSCVQELQD